MLKYIFGSWSTDSIVYARSAPQANVVTGQNPFAGSNLSGPDSVQRPDVVPRVPFYLYPSGAPGGKVINPAAFATPVPATAQGDLGRNALRGFGAMQWDLTVRRQFHFTERLSLQARADFFNILNHPNFGSPINFLTSPQFGQSTQMLQTTWEAAARVAASILCIRLAARARSSWHLSCSFEMGTAQGFP